MRGGEKKGGRRREGNDTPEPVAGLDYSQFVPSGGSPPSNLDPEEGKGEGGGGEKGGEKRPRFHWVTASLRGH